MEMHVFVKNMFSKGLNIGLLQQGWVEKTVHGVDAHWLSCKENDNRDWIY